MKNTEIYTDTYGMVTTIKLNNVIAAAQKHVAKNFYGRKNPITFCDFLGQKRMVDLRRRFEAEVKRIGVDYTFGDCLA